MRVDMSIAGVPAAAANTTRLGGTGDRAVRHCKPSLKQQDGLRVI
jgi:hypothetical protein